MVSSGFLAREMRHVPSIDANFHFVVCLFPSFPFFSHVPFVFPTCLMHIHALRGSDV